MISKARYLLLLEVQLKYMNSLRKQARALLIDMGETFPDEVLLPPAGGWRDTSTSYGMLRWEVSQLRRNLGGAERREYERLKRG